METKIIKVTNEKDEALLEAGKILRAGGTVAFPTETVYGLGANALDAQAIDQIFIAKGRPNDNPLIVHISKKSDLEDLVLEISRPASLLMDEFWPGPLTLIFKKASKVSSNVTAGLDTLAIRMPSNKIANKLIELAGVPIAAPSANISGKPSPTDGKHVIEDLDGKVNCIIISDKSDVGLESTILDTTQTPPILLRPGGITVEAIEAVIGKIEVDPALDLKVDDNIRPKAPGMKYTHYSPKAEVIVVRGDSKAVVAKINDMKALYKNKKVGIMCTNETLSYYEDALCISLGSKAALDEIASNLFATLRAFDEFRVDIVLAEGYDTLGMGKAIMNRLNKAAGFNIVDV